MEKSYFVPVVSLRCGKCNNKTSHALIDFSEEPKDTITLNYECQDCGERKKMFVFVTYKIS